MAKARKNVRTMDKGPANSPPKEFEKPANERLVSELEDKMRKETKRKKRTA